MVKICVFDTETTDKPPYLPGKDWNERSKNDSRLLNYSDLNVDNSLWEQMLPLWPSTIQLSYIIYDTEKPEESKIYNKYVDIPVEVVITESSFAIHHINKEFIEKLPSEKKSPIEDVVLEFLKDIYNSQVKYIVGHNVQFDRKMIISEILRYKSKKPELMNYMEFMMNDKHFACTMTDTTQICNLLMEIKYKDKKTGEDKVFFKPKSPKLIESYFHYFGYYPIGEALHDAIVDVILCLRVFMKYKYDIDVCGLNNIITDYIIKISPEGYVCPIDITEKMNNQITETINSDIGFNDSVVIDVNESNKKVACKTTKKRRKRGKKNRKNKKTKRVK
jgi:DNA polymerase III epsilon subunit-like protein